MVSEANQVSRGMVETAAMLAGLHRKQQDFVRELASAEYAERRAAGNWYLATPSVTEHVGEENKEKLEKFLKDLDEAEFPIKKLFVQTVTTQTGLEALYAIYRHLSHHYGHASMTSASHFATVNPETGAKGILWSREYGRDHMEQSLGWACSNFFGALLAMDEMLPTPGIRQRIAEAFEAYKRLVPDK